MAKDENWIKAGSWEWFYREAEPVGTARSPVVLLHGLVSQSYGYRHVLPALAEYGFRAIAPDWLGHGFSEQPDRRDFPYTPDAFIQAFGDFLQALEITQCSLVVQGFLGTVGLQYALRHPDQIDRITILNAPVTVSSRLPRKIGQLGWPMIGDVMRQDPLLVDQTLEGGRLSGRRPGFRYLSSAFLEEFRCRPGTPNLSTPTATLTRLLRGIRGLLADNRYQG
ncbi:MAG: alpha/beta fold hydrolase [Leptodesmis sp.]